MSVSNRKRRKISLQPRSLSRALARAGQVQARERILPSDPRIILIQRIPIFRSIRSDVLQCLMNESRIVRIPKGEFFFRQGDQASSLFVLESGLARVSKTGDAQRFDLGFIHEGECFGEVAWIDQSTRSANVIADNDCLAVEIPSAALDSVSDYDPAQYTLILANLARGLCWRLRRTDEKLIRLGALLQIAVPAMPSEDPAAVVSGQDSQPLEWPALFPV